MPWGQLFNKVFLSCFNRKIDYSLRFSYVDIVTRGGVKQFIRRGFGNTNPYHGVRPSRCGSSATVGLRGSHFGMPGSAAALCALALLSCVGREDGCCRFAVHRGRAWACRTRGLCACTAGSLRLELPLPPASAGGSAEQVIQKDFPVTKFV